MLHVDERPVMKILDRVPTYDDVITFTNHDVYSVDSIKGFLEAKRKGKVMYDL